MTKIPHDAWILVGDGRKALVLRNQGDAVFPNFKTVDIFKDSGRSNPGNHHDWHDIAEHRFANHIATLLDVHNAAGDISSLVVVAPPRTLADLRHSFSDSLSAKIVGEINKDLTKHPISEIERLLAGEQ